MIRTLLISFLLSVVALSAPASDDWLTPTRVEVREGELLRRNFSDVTMVTTREGDVHVLVSGSQAGKTTSGEMFIVSSRILLVKGVELSPGAEIDAIDVPALQVQLVLKLLAKASATGPDSVRSTRRIDVTEASQAIEVTTSSASGQFPAPWSLRGDVQRESSNRLRFAMTFSWKDAAAPLTLTGAWERTKPAPSAPDSLSVVGFRAFTLGPYSRQDANGTMVDYGAQELTDRFTTLGEVRAAAKRRD